MKATMQSYPNLHPMVVFWIGVLTGAMVVGLVFFYKVLVPGDYTNYLLKTYSSPTYSLKSTGISPLSIGDPMGG